MRNKQDKINRKIISLPDILEGLKGIIGTPLMRIKKLTVITHCIIQCTHYEVNPFLIRLNTKNSLNLIICFMDIQFQSHSIY